MSPRRGWPMSATHSRATYLVAKMEHARCLQGSDQVELDVFGWEALEQQPALAEQHGHQLDLEHVEQPSLQTLLSRVGAVQQDISLARGRLCLLHARRDPVAHEVDTLVPVVCRGGVGRNKDRHAVV